MKAVEPAGWNLDPVVTGLPAGIDSWTAPGGAAAGRAEPSHSAMCFVFNLIAFEWPTTLALADPPGPLSESAEISPRLLVRRGSRTSNRISKHCGVRQDLCAIGGAKGISQQKCRVPP